MRLLNWFDRLHPAIKIMFVLAGGLLSATSSRLPENLQDFGLWVGITIGVVALVGLALHAIRDFRRGGKVSGADLIILGLGGVAVFSIIALAGFVWHIKSPTKGESKPQTATIQSAQASTATKSLLPAHYKTAGHRERLGEIFFKLRMTIDQDVRPLTTAGHRLVSTWESKKGGTIDANQFVQVHRPILDEIIQKAENAEVEIYVTLYKNHPAYSDLLNEITLRDRSPQQEWPIVQFDKAAQAFRKALLAFYTITTNDQKAAAGMNTLVTYPQAEFQNAIHQLNGWADSTAQRIKTMEEDLGR